MVAGTYTVITVTTGVRLALGWVGTDKTLTDAQINEFIINNMETTPSTYSFQLVTAATTGPNGVYKCFHGRPYGLYLWGPTMAAEDDCVYVINSKGFITVTSGTPVATAISVTGTPVDFATTVVEILHYLATHRCQEISESIGSGSMSPMSVHSQIVEMIQYWKGVEKIA